MTRLHLIGKRLVAYAYKIGDGLLVKSGSQMSSAEKRSCRPAEKALRKELIDKGIVKNWIFTEDVLFKSAARASKCIVGYSVSINEVWLDDNGVKLGEQR